MVPLFNHQSDAIEFLRSNGNCGMVAHEPGLGKTRTALELYRRVGNHMYPSGHFADFSLLVVAPLSLLEAAWHEDLRKFTPDLSFWNLHKDGWPTRTVSGEIHAPHANVYAINYDFFKFEDNVSKALPFFRSRRWMCVLDESSKIKNHAAATTKNLLKIKRMFDFRVVMSGTPAPNSEWEYWPQVEFARPGMLGKSFFQFRHTYFHLRGRNGAPINTAGMVMTKQVMADLFAKQGAEYAITPERRAALFNVIGPVIHARRKEDCLDLPEQVDEVRLVRMGAAQTRAYKQMKNLLVAEIEGQDVVAQVALAKLMKLREITSGFAISENQEVVETECPKMQALEDILDELGDRQAIVWGNFTWEIEKIVGVLTKRSIDQGNESARPVTLYGGTKDREESIRSFISGEARYLVANPHSAAHGLTFVNCSNQIFFSLDYSWEAYEQARARTHRAGQVNKCTYYHLLADGTIDQEILSVLRKKGSAQEIVFKLREGK